jgi:hypothetical protein
VTTRLDIEDLQTTKTEKLLAVVLAIFLLIGGIWAYQEIDDWVRDDAQTYFAPPPSSPEIERANRARQRVAAASRAEERALGELELRREAYRTALDAGRPAPRLEQSYLAAQRRYRQAQRERAAAEQELQAAEPAAQAAQRRLSEDFASERRREDRNIFLWRLALVLAGMAIGYALLWHLHGRRSRYLPLAFAAVVSATLFALVMAGDYLSDYFNPLDLGPLILALVGSALAIASFWALQRYLDRRLPGRRVRKQQCPYCGYPNAENNHCEGCGRELVAPCSKCDAERRVGTLHCRACGAL